MANSPDATAPAFVPGAQDLPWWRRMVAQGLGYFGPSAVFVALPALSALDEPPGVRLGVVLGSVLIGVLFVGTTLVMHWSEPRRWLWLGGLAGAVALVAVLSGGDAHPAYFAVYVTAAAAVLLRWRKALVVVLATTLVLLPLAVIAQDVFGVVMATMGLALGLSIGLGLEANRARQALRAAEQRTAVLAVAAERERIGRDLHDILGHSLTTIAVKADLIGRLLGRDDEAARAEVDSLATIARGALSDVRATASGMREVRLASEIASARSVLTAAGIEPTTPAAVPVLGDTVSEVLGYVVREVVTNVVRHSAARACTISCETDGVNSASVTIRDDGHGLGGRAPGTGTGLAGLRARVEGIGGTLTVESTGAGTTVTARVDLAARP